MTPTSMLPSDAGHRSRRFRLLPVLVVALFAASGRAEAACETNEVARLPLTAAQGHLLANVRLDGESVDLVVDTGAAVSVLDRGVADRMKLKDAPAGPAAIIGLGGRVERAFKTVTVRRLALGALTIPNATMMQGDLNRGRPPAMQIDGILGADLLARYDVEIDPGQGRLVLHATHGCDGEMPGWPAMAGVVALAPFSSPRLRTVPVLLDGTALTALVDTGASQTVLFEAGLRRVGAAARPAAGDEAGFGLGATARQKVRVRLHRFATLTIGKEVVTAPRIAIAHADPLKLDMVLGLDLLGGRRLWLSYATNRLFLDAR